jgi:hypothetical protein
MPGAVIVHHHTRYKTYPGEVTGFVFFCCLIASVGGCIFGYDIGLTGTRNLTGRRRRRRHYIRFFLVVVD